MEYKNLTLRNLMEIKNHTNYTKIKIKKKIPLYISNLTQENQNKKLPFVDQNKKNSFCKLK